MFKLCALRKAMRINNLNLILLREIKRFTLLETGGESLGKKILLIIGTSIILILAALGGLGVFLYYQGPRYALEKAKTIAKEQFHTEIDYKQAGFIGKQGIFIEDLQIKLDSLILKIKHFQALANVNLKEKRVEIFELLFEQLSVNGEFISDEKEISTVKDGLSEPSGFEKLLLDPPAQIKVHRVKFKNLSAQVSLVKKTQVGRQKKTKVALSGLDLEMDLTISPGAFWQKVSLQTFDPLQIERTEQNRKEFIRLSKFKVSLTSSIQRSANQDWVYEASPIEIESHLTNAEMKSDFTMKAGASIVKLQAEAKGRSVQLLKFDLFRLDKLHWDLVSAFRQVQATGKPAFQFLGKSGSDFKIESKGKLYPAKAQSSRFDLPWTWEAGIKIYAGPFQIEGVKTDFNATGKWNDNKGRISFETKPKNLIKFAGATELQKKQIQLDGQLEVNVPLILAEKLIHQKLQGKISMPVHFLVIPAEQLNSHDVSFETILDFNDFNFSGKNIEIVGLNGEIPIAERIIFDPSVKGLSAFKFKNLFTQNPFERVDYERLDPLVRSNDKVTVERIQWEGRSFGPFKGIIDLAQNLVSVHSFSMDFGQGSASGELFVDLLPKNERIGFLGRLTQLDLGQILPQRYLGRSNVNGPLPFSARTGMVVSVKRKSLDGRMDVTQVGGPQLIALINLLDPNYENEKMNKVRSLLQVGYPTAVNMGFHEGALDLTVDIEAMGLKSYQHLPGISIQSFIDKVLNEKLRFLSE